MARWQMDARAAVVAFLSNTLARRRDRFVEFASRPKAQDKLLAALYHDLHECFDRRRVVDAFPDPVWRAPAWAFAPPDCFGLRYESFGDAVEDLVDSFLVISLDGRYGLHREETRVDFQLLIDAFPATGKRA